MVVSASSSLRLLCCNSCEKRLVCEPQVSSTVLLSGLTDTLLIAFAATFAAHLSFTSGFSYLIVLHLYTWHLDWHLFQPPKKKYIHFSQRILTTQFAICSLNPLLLDFEYLLPQKWHTYFLLPVSLLYSLKHLVSCARTFALLLPQDFPQFEHAKTSSCLGDEGVFTQCI